MDLWAGEVMRLLIKGLDVATLRQEVTAQNLANLNTAGYKRSYVTFESEFRRAMERSTPLWRTHERHLPAGNSASVEPQVRVERHTARRNDGNNVDLEQEMLSMVTNQLRYNALVQQVSDRFATWRYVINEGRR